MKRLFSIIILCCFIFCVGACDTPSDPSEAQTPFVIPQVTLSSVESLDTNKPTLEPANTLAPTSTPYQIQLDINTIAIEDYADYIMESMTLDEKVGQPLMYGVSGTDEPSETFMNIFLKYHVGNMILYGNNIDTSDADGGFLRASGLIEKTHAGCTLPMLVSIDLEGGGVRRFRWDRELFSAKRLGDIADEDIAFEQFKYIGEGLASAGINMNLAPCVDVAEYPMETFLGSRIISSDPNIVSAISTACIRGMSSACCLSVAKHFPGHGSTSADSHVTTPIVNKTLDELMAYDIAPYRDVIEAGVDGILVAHILYPEVDPDYISSMSHIFLTHILRNELGFDGLIISDDIRMAGVLNNFSADQAGVRFILAGGDIVLCGAVARYQSQIAEGLIAAVNDGTISEERLNESVRRVIKAKLKYVNFMPLS